MRALGDYLGVKVHACVGGTSVREDQRILSAGVHVVVGTPGRVFDMLRRQSLRADYIKIFVLDEADEMLSRGFKDQVRLFIRSAPFIMDNLLYDYVCTGIFGFYVLMYTKNLVRIGRLYYRKGTVMKRKDCS